MPSTNAQIFQQLMSELGQYGIFKAKYGLSAISDTREKGLVPRSLSNFGTNWQVIANQHGMRAETHLIDHCIVGNSPLWFSELHDWLFNLPPSQRQMERYELTVQAGLTNGVCLPVATNSPLLAAGVALIGDPSLPIATFNRETRSALREVEPLIRDFHGSVRHAELYLDGARLSNRETQCLMLCASGYRSARIADSLQISERTVEKFFVTAKTKLRADTTPEAVAKALQLGLLNPL